MFELFTDTSGKWRWRLRARNQEIVATSEAYEGGENAARDGIEAAVHAVSAAINENYTHAEEMQATLVAQAAEVVDR